MDEKGYAIVPSEYVDGENVENYHIFRAKIVSEVLKVRIDIEIIEPEEQYELACKVNIKKTSELPEDFLKSLKIDSSVFANVISKCNLRINEFLKIDYLLDIKEQYNFYSNKYGIFYFDNEEEARVFGAILGRELCGTCVSTLYADERIK